MARHGGACRAKGCQDETRENNSPPPKPIREAGQDKRAKRRKRHPGEELRQLRLVECKTLGNPRRCDAYNRKAVTLIDEQDDDCGDDRHRAGRALRLTNALPIGANLLISSTGRSHLKPTQTARESRENHARFSTSRHSEEALFLGTPANELEER